MNWRPEDVVALIIAVSGLVTAVGAVVIGWRGHGKANAVDAKIDALIAEQPKPPDGT